MDTLNKTIRQHLKKEQAEWKDIYSKKQQALEDELQRKIS